MNFVFTAWAILLGNFLSVGSSRTPDGVEFAATINCTANTQPCGPGPSCCALGFKCNYRRGIPVCENLSKNYESGYDNDLCADPYLFRCDEVLGIPGFCCQIGTVCSTEGNDNIVQCINAIGLTASAVPSATTGLVPASTPIPGSDAGIFYSPSEAWNTSAIESNCTTSLSLHVTDTINATISLSYTGPSIMVNTISSANGGVFSVIVDDFDTTSVVDTYSGSGVTLPLCYPNQFPPFVVTPPGYENKTSHTISLVYKGASTSAPNGTKTSVGHFDSFAIPDLESLLMLTSNSQANRQKSLSISFFSACLYFFICILIS